MTSATATTAAATGRPGKVGRIARFARSVAIAPILLYQRLISPAIPRRCKYEPTCSRYAAEAIRGYGVWRGLVLAPWRLLRGKPRGPRGDRPVQGPPVCRARPPGGGV